MKKLVAAIALFLFLVPAMAAEILRSDHPDRYVVRDGDTLWDIANMFLTDAWMWQEIWHVNPDIENPHLIFPGDTILLSYVDGEPQLTLERGKGMQSAAAQRVRQGDRNVKLLPTVRSRAVSSSIPAIPLDAISSLITTGRIVEQYTLADAPHILAGKADRLIFGPGDEFYARGQWQEGTSVYGIFRQGEVYQDPETREVLGFEAIEVGSAAVEERDGDLYTLSLRSVKQDVRIGDRLLPTEERRVESTFFPSAPTEPVEGVIMTVLGGVTQVGRNDVIAVNRGRVNGVDVGNVLAIYKSGNVARDRVNRERVRLPSERAGLLMVFRSFDKMAYGLVLETEEPLRVGDVVRKP